MINRFKLLCSAFLLAVMTGCAIAPVPKIDANPARLASVKTVEIIRPPEVKTYLALNFGHPALALALVGGIIVAKDQQNKQEEITTAYRAAGLAVSSNLADRVAANLTAAGFQVKIVDGPWQETPNGYTLTLEKFSSEADAILLISPNNVGFVKMGLTTDWLPTVHLTATLLGKDKKEEIYRGYHAVGWIPKQKGWVESASQVTFSNFSTITEDPKASSQSLIDASNAVADTVVASLKH